MGAAEANDRSPNVAKAFTEGGSRRSSLFQIYIYQALDEFQLYRQ